VAFLTQWKARPLAQRTGHDSKHQADEFPEIATFPEELPTLSVDKDWAGTTIGCMKPTLTETLQQAIRESGLLANEVARRAKVTPGQLSRFLSNQRTLTLPSVDRICKVLGLELRRVSRQRKAR
jgi:DNA-binding phage protein